MRESKMTDYLPINPCEGCEYDSYCPVFQANRLKICEKSRAYQANLAALERALDAVEDEQTIIKDGIGVPIRVIESMLVTIREAKG
jgi:hypothetical protein